VSFLIPIAIDDAIPATLLRFVERDAGGIATGDYLAEGLRRIAFRINYTRAVLHLLPLRLLTALQLALDRFTDWLSYCRYF